MRVVFVVAAVVAACTACGDGKKAGPPLVRVPDLRGLPTQKALYRLADVGLCVSRVERMHGIGFSPESVVAQDPPAGTLVRRLHRVSFRTSPPSADGGILEIVVAHGCPPPVPLFAMPAGAG